MEFKDKLKKLRTEKGISQQALADAIFVSRSAVAKWENGLGLPSEESYNALLDYFQVEKEEVVTEEPEVVIVEKNKRIHKLRLVLLTGLTVLLLMLLVLSLLIISGKFGFTSKMAAGEEFADERCIYTGDYDIYYYTWDEGNEYEVIAGFRPVKKVLLGYMVYEEDYEYREVYCDGERVGIIYSLEGSNCYYNIFRRDLVSEVPSALLSFDNVKVKGVAYPVIYNSYFVTDEVVEEFEIEGNVLKVGE